MNPESSGQVEPTSLNFFGASKGFEDTSIYPARTFGGIAHPTILRNVQFAIVWLAPTSAFLCFAAIWLKRCIRDFGLNAVI